MANYYEAEVRVCELAEKKRRSKILTNSLHSILRVVNRVTIGRALARMRRKKLSICFQGWVETCNLILDAKKMLVGTLIRKRSESAAFAVSKLAEHTAWARDLQDTRQRQEHAVRVSLARMRKGNLSRSFRGWHGKVVTFRRNRVRVNRSLARAKNRILSVSFDTWLDRCQRIRAMRTFIERRLRILTRKVMVTGFVLLRSHRDEADLADVKNERASRMLQRIVARVKGRAFSRWKAFRMERIQQRLKITRALARMRKKVVATTLQQWQVYVELRRKAVESILRPFRRRARQKQLKAMVMFRDFFEAKRAEELRAKQERTIVSRAARKVKYRLLSRAL